MSEKQRKPKPLFDTIEHIDDELTTCIQEYLSSLGIENINREYQLSKEFLNSYLGSQDTFNAYRRDVERFLQWAWLIQAKPVAQITRNDLRDYIQFVAAPPKYWIGKKTVQRFVTRNGERQFNPEWHPFSVRVSKLQSRLGKNPDKETFALGPKSLRALFAVLSTFFKFLQEEEYISANPVLLIRQKNRFMQKVQQHKVTRKLSDIQWKFVIETAEEMANNDTKHERTLFVMSAFYLLGLRISELAETPGRIPIMGHFAPDKNSLWWFTTVGKGNKLREVAIPDEMLAVLKRYRLSRDLTPLPTRDEQSPLLHKERGNGGLGTRQVRNLVQECFDRAVTKLQKADLIDQSQDLQTATVHWLRHTAITADISHRPREHVRDDVGHENPATMDRYIDTDRHARHLSAKDKRLKPFEKEEN